MDQRRVAERLVERTRIVGEAARGGLVAPVGKPSLGALEADEIEAEGALGIARDSAHVDSGLHQEFHKAARQPVFADAREIAHPPEIADETLQIPAGVEGIARKTLRVETLRDRRKLHHRLADA